MKLSTFLEGEAGVGSSKRLWGSIFCIASLIYAYLGLFIKELNFNYIVFVGILGTGTGLLGLGVLENIQPPTAGSGKI
jgi:hypothetical protein